MSWTAVSLDFSKAIEEAYHGKIIDGVVKIPPGLAIKIDVDLDPAFQKIVMKNPSVLDEIQKVAKRKADEAVKDAVAAFRVTAQKAEREQWDQKTADRFSQQLTASLRTRMQVAGREMAEHSQKTLEYYKNSQASLKAFRIKSGFKIATQSVAIAASTAVTVVSHGALTPFAGVAIARSGLAIAQEITKLATGCTFKAKLVDAELAVLKAALGKNLANKELMVKIRKNGAETALAVLSGLAGVETPTVKSCRKRIEEHHIDIAKLDTKSKEFSQKIYKLMDEGKAWDHKCQAMRAQGLKQPNHFNPAKLKQLEQGLKAHETALDTLLESTIKVNQAVAQAWENHYRFEKAIKGLAQSVQQWTKYVDVAVGATVDIAMAVGKPDQVMELAVNTFIAASNSAVQAAVG